LVGIQHASDTLSLQFYDTGPPEFDAYYAAQRECQNSALLQMMAAAVAEATEANQGYGGPDPVLVNSNPKTMDDAVTNLHAFSTQGRFNHLQPTPDVSLVPINSLPRMRQCYGWMAVDG
jgi:hypothetical protein